MTDAENEPGEFIASHISEQIEEMTRQLLKALPDLGDVKLDFGTAIDGSLEIWVDGERYNSVEEIPDECIRRAIAEAVEKYNH